MTIYQRVFAYLSIINFTILLTLLYAINVNAQEVIQKYDSNIIIDMDGSLNVTETITVSAEGKEIKRGIYRDFPTKYKDIYGNNYSVKFELLSVMRNGQAEDYHTKPISNGIRIYIGHKNRMLQHGTHTFTIKYYTNRQLGFFKNYDELYWNVTGNGWAFPILQASAKIQLPPDVSVNQIDTDGYTGAKGDKGKNFIVSMLNDNTVFFDSTDNLPLHHGLSVVVNWPKGYITEPTQAQKFDWFYQDNRPAIVGFGGLTFLILYFILAWIKVGKDPQKGVIYPQYEPEKRHSPASMRFVYEMGYDKKVFTSALVNMAVKGYLIISDSGRHFTIEKTGQQVKLSIGELAIAKNIFRYKNIITFKKSEHKTIKEALVAHEKVLKRDYEKIYFQTNKAQLIPGWLISIATLALTFVAIESSENKEVVGFFIIWLSFWSIGVSFLCIAMYQAWMNVKSLLTLFPALFSTAFAAPFLAGEIFGLYMLWDKSGTGVFVVFILVISTNIFFYEWMKAPTHKGRTLLDKIEGFKLYLNVAEADEIKFKYAPVRTPELFEKFLPYAIALGVETQWAERFNSVFAQLEQQGKSHSPYWYHGNHWNTHNLSNFSSSMASSLSSAISSSSTAPGSSSGSGGGGSSGGGGGGGGGGGW